MIVVRNTFRLKYGQAKPAIEAWKNGQKLMQSMNMNMKYRILTDLTGEAYNLVFETEHDSLAAWEDMMKNLANPDWRKWYETFVAYVEGGHREIYNVVGTS
jgi:hypothetical protein